MIEPARTAASVKFKINVKAVKNHIHDWNEQHQLGLTDLRERAYAATWQFANCVIVVNKLETQVTEIMLLVARRQSNYRWVMGFQPEDSARETWNRIMQLMPREIWITPYRLLDRPWVQIRDDIAYLAEPRQMSEIARLVMISEAAQARSGVDALGRAHDWAIDRVHKEIAEAQAFKREQDALRDLTPSQLADAFWHMLWANKPPGKTIHRRATVTLNPPPTKAPLKKGELPDLETMRQYHPDYNPETAKAILNALSDARKDWELVGGRWGPEIIAKHMGIAKGTISHYLTAFRKAGLRKWGSIQLP